MLYQYTETPAFGLTLDDVRAALPHVSIPDGATLDPDWGFSAYAETAPPAPAWNQAAQEVAPVGGQQLWELVDLPLDQVRATALAALQADADAAAQAPYAYDFGQAATVNDDGSAGPAAGVLHLQMDAGSQENWKAVISAALVAVVAQSTAAIPIRVQENVAVQASPQQVVALLTGAFTRNSAYIVSVLPGLQLKLKAASDAAGVAAVTWPT